MKQLGTGDTYRYHTHVDNTVTMQPLALTPV